MSSLERLRQVEKEHWDRFHRERDLLRPINVDEINRTLLQPSYACGVDIYCDNRIAFYQRILQEGGWRGRCVLDYGCGDGKWTGYYVLTGAERAVGFDLGEMGIRRGWQRLISQGLAGRVRLLRMDATRLGFPDNAFELVIGNAVLHHVIKYPGIFEELHRVLKPGARAYFMENLADFPLWRLWWRLRGRRAEGDVPIFAGEVRRKASMFSQVEIRGDTFLYSIRRFLWKPSAGPVRRLLLRTCKRLDDRLFERCPGLRAWGSFSYIVLVK
jgi:SAM-dependent methyltransferase